MTAEEIFKEVLKSPEIRTKLDIPEKEITNLSFWEESEYEIIEVIRTVLINKQHRRSNDNIYNTLKNQIIRP